MAETEKEKWAAYYDPLAMGMLDSRPGNLAGPHMDNWQNGLVLTLGFFWPRIRGGHNLRKRTDHKAPTLADPIVGVCDGDTATIQTGPTCEKTFGVNYVFGLSAVGAGGVEGPVEALDEVVFPPSLPMVGLVPNAPIGFRGIGLGPDSVFRFSWKYNPIGERVAPAYFRLYAGLNGTDIDESSSVLSVAYVAGQIEYSADIDFGLLVFGTPEKYFSRFLLRAAVDLTGGEEKNINEIEVANYVTAPTADQSFSGGAAGIVAPYSRRV